MIRTRMLSIALGIATVAGVGALSPAQATALPFGPYTCQQGYVWRDAYHGDTVCVTPGERDTAHAENASAGARREPHGGAYGPDTCKQGFVWRETRPADHVCVTPDRRDRARAQNSEGVRRLADATQLPVGSVGVRTETHDLGGWIYVDGGGGLSPHARIEFWAAGVYHNGPTWLGSRQSDGNGYLPRETTSLVDVRCTIPRDTAATIVAVDTRTGIAKSAGTSRAFIC